MVSKARVSLVLLIYFLLSGMVLALPATLLFLNDVPRRFEVLACFYIFFLFFFVIRNFLLGGGLHIRLTSQVNQVYGAILPSIDKRFIDLHCLSLFRIAGVWLVFPSVYLSRIVGQNDLLRLYESALDQMADNSFCT